MKSITTDRTIDNNKQPDNDTVFDEIKNSRKFGKDKKVRVIPGFHLTLGITVTMLSLIVLIPLASVMVYSLKLPPAEFIRLVTTECRQFFCYKHWMFIHSGSNQLRVWNNNCMDVC